MHPVDDEGLNMDWDLNDDGVNRSSTGFLPSHQEEKACCVGIGVEEDLMNAIEKFRLKPRPAPRDMENIRSLLMQFRHTFQEQKKWQLLCTLVIEQCHRQHEKVMELLMSGMRTPCCDEEFENDKMSMIQDLASDTSNPLAIDARSIECFQEICRMRRELLGMWSAEEEMHKRIGCMMDSIEKMHERTKVAAEERSIEDAKNLRDVVGRLEASSRLVGASAARVAELDAQNTTMLQQAVDMNLLITDQNEKIAGLKEFCSSNVTSPCICSSEMCRHELGEAVKKRVQEYVEQQKEKRRKLIDS
jgi:hypothetical protein